MILPDSIQRLIDALSRLPGIGPKTASRLTFFLLRSPEELSRGLAQALLALKSETSTCRTCFNITEAGWEECAVCASQEREAEMICVVEEPLDVLALERSGAYRGRYHVLHGVLSPIEGVGPDDLRIRELLERLRRGGVNEVILATNPSLEGDATAMYLRQQVEALGVRVTRLARGLPAGGDLEYADPNTLSRALLGRQEMP
ncbi:MAG: recombination mediator RecR [Anaerolineales bacterium]|nr:recombination mediator RecR [Anaerolineales bacterium]